ncbi:hypothetical protein EJ04DRAFT_498481 [Polyplosphaeria fusca]|uniref:Ribosomal RNA-processing protein 7 n=1 Tax=Polyplosphaeria fusca TaxID=682080 RepID=A0A9P4QUY7_9PLEO|nr:hypothetical protein EJ04DRAFT_498481 [Polyplosphaeria fusca]
MAPKKSSIPKTVADFIVLPLTLPALPGLPESCADAKHYLYIKPHEPSHATARDEQSLFISNVPFDANEDNIRALFTEQLGGLRVANVEFDSSVPAQASSKRWKDVKNNEDGDKRGKKRKRDEEVVAEGVVEDDESRLPNTWPSELRRGGSCAIVVFVDKSSAHGAMKAVKKAAKESKEVRWKGGDGLGGERYKKHHALRYPSKEALQSSINAYLTQFNRAETARNRLRKKQRSVPDAEGFVTVTRGGRAGPARIEDAERKKTELEERRKKNGAKDDFYRFQTREKRKDAENELRRAFEKDRRRVLDLRARRGRLRPEV